MRFTQNESFENYFWNYEKMQNQNYFFCDVNPQNTTLWTEYYVLPKLDGNESLKNYFWNLKLVPELLFSTSYSFFSLFLLNCLIKWSFGKFECPIEKDDFCTQIVLKIWELDFKTLNILVENPGYLKTGNLTIVM